MGSCVVELLKLEGNRLYVKRLDAIDGTPVLDIKIYIPHYDAFPLAETPLNWCMSHELITTSRHFHWDTVNVSLTLGLQDRGQSAAGPGHLPRRGGPGDSGRRAFLCPGDRGGHRLQCAAGQFFFRRAPYLAGNSGSLFSREKIVKWRLGSTIIFTPVPLKCWRSASRYCSHRCS